MAEASLAFLTDVGLFIKSRFSRRSPTMEEALAGLWTLPLSKLIPVAEDVSDFFGIQLFFGRSGQDSCIRCRDFLLLCGPRY